MQSPRKICKYKFMLHNCIFSIARQAFHAEQVLCKITNIGIFIPEITIADKILLLYTMANFKTYITAVVTIRIAIRSLPNSTRCLWKVGRFLGRLTAW
jgi:hypothetical protein